MPQILDAPLGWLEICVGTNWDVLEPLCWDGTVMQTICVPVISNHMVVPELVLRASQRPRVWPVTPLGLVNSHSVSKRNLLKVIFSLDIVGYKRL